MTPLRVLVLDAISQRRQELLGLFRSARHHAAAAPDARGAAEGLSAGEFDILVLDLSTPELDLAGLRRSIFPADSGEPPPLEEVERRHLALMLRHTGGNKRRAAHLLGISRSTLLNKLRKYGLAMMPR